MTGNEANTLGERMERLEQSQEEMRAEMRRGFEELNRALLGGLDGQGGLLGRVRMNEAARRDYELRLVEIEGRVAEVEKWINDRNAQGRLLDWLIGGGAVAVVGFLIWLIQMFSG